MKEVQNKNHTDEAKRLNEELDQNLKDLQPESKEAFQGFEVKEEKNEKKKKKSAKYSRKNNIKMCSKCQIHLRGKKQNASKKNRQLQLLAYY